MHFHTLAVDGVFEKQGDGVRVHEAPPPSKDDLEDVARRVHDRAVVWLRRHGYLDERSADERGNEPPAQTPIDGLARIALAGGTFVGRPSLPKDGTDEKLERKEPRFSARFEGFDVHCAVRIAADDDAGRERLLRYCARPPFAVDRIEELRDGRIAYAMKTPRRGSTHRVMTPMEFMGRLAILVPPPFFPLVRFHGVFAARSAWRDLVTPKPPDGVARPKKPKACKKQPCEQPARTLPVTAAPVTPSTSTHARDHAPIVTALPAPSAAVLATGAPCAPSAMPVPAADPTTITVKHWQRILDGELYATSSRIEWAVLLQRTFGVDALRCPTCDQRMRVLSTITDPPVVKKILAHLGMRTEPLPRARARDPTGQLDFGDFAA